MIKQDGFEASSIMIKISIYAEKNAVRGEECKSKANFALLSLFS